MEFINAAALLVVFIIGGQPSLLVRSESNHISSNNFDFFDCWDKTNIFDNSDFNIIANIDNVTYSFDIEGSLWVREDTPAPTVELTAMNYPSKARDTLREACNDAGMYYVEKCYQSLTCSITRQGIHHSIARVNICVANNEYCKYSDVAVDFLDQIYQQVDGRCRHDEDGWNTECETTDNSDSLPNDQVSDTCTEYLKGCGINNRPECCDGLTCQWSFHHDYKACTPIPSNHVERVQQHQTEVICAVVVVSLLLCCCCYFVFGGKCSGFFSSTSAKDKYSSVALEASIEMTNESGFQDESQPSKISHP